jgi:hypothetical protein
MSDQSSRPAPLSGGSAGDRAARQAQIEKWDRDNPSPDLTASDPGNDQAGPCLDQKAAPAPAPEPTPSEPPTPASQAPAQASPDASATPAAPTSEPAASAPAPADAQPGSPSPALDAAPAA